MSYVDIHSHILPGLDDGAKDEKETLRMLKLAEQSGISDIIATPHYHYRRGHAAPELIRATVERIQQMILESGMKIRLYPGNELYYTHELLDAVKSGNALTLADTEYVLLEFSPGVEARRIQNAVYQFLSEGYYPIIAHMERYEVFLKNPGFALEIAEMGAYFQVNAGSITGEHGWKTKYFARRMVKNGLIQFVATDCHDAQKRAPKWDKALSWLDKTCGSTETEKYLQKHPRAVLESLMI